MKTKIVLISFVVAIFITTVLALWIWLFFIPFPISYNLKSDTTTVTSWINLAFGMIGISILVTSFCWKSPGYTLYKMYELASDSKQQMLRKMWDTSICPYDHPIEVVFRTSGNLFWKTLINLFFSWVLCVLEQLKVPYYIVKYKILKLN